MDRRPGFPENPYQALALLYVQMQATAENTPEDLQRMYEDAYNRIVLESKISK